VLVYSVMGDGGGAMEEVVVHVHQCQLTPLLVCFDTAGRTIARAGSG